MGAEDDDRSGNGGQRQRIPEAEWIDQGRRAGQSCVEKINQTLRPHIHVGEDEKEEANRKAAKAK